MNGEDDHPIARALAVGPSSGSLVVERSWSAGDQLELDLEMSPRFTLPHPAIDAIRGCAALELGPLVYCVEQADLPAGTRLDQLEVALDESPTMTTAYGLPDGMLALSAKASVRAVSVAGGSWPYQGSDGLEASVLDDTNIIAIPYFAWANREAGPMRVWLPIAGTERGSDQS